jgi:hypothetical protein
LNGTHQVANASAASQGVQRRAAAGPSRGITSRDSSHQHSSPSTVEGSRIHSVLGEISDQA